MNKEEAKKVIEKDLAKALKEVKAAEAPKKSRKIKIGYKDGRLKTAKTATKTAKTTAKKEIATKATAAKSTKTQTTKKSK